jgi:hypothetical protein
MGVLRVTMPLNRSEVPAYPSMGVQFNSRAGSLADTALLLTLGVHS